VLSTSWTAKAYFLGAKAYFLGELDILLGGENILLGGVIHRGPVRALVIK
jgi:hypothetical protein